MKRGSKKTYCEGCGRMRAGGGQRFCWECLAKILCGEPTPLYFVPTGVLLHSGAVSYPTNHHNPYAKQNGGAEEIP